MSFGRSPRVCPCPPQIVPVQPSCVLELCLVCRVGIESSWRAVLHFWLGAGHFAQPHTLALAATPFARMLNNRTSMHSLQETWSNEGSRLILLLPMVLTCMPWKSFRHPPLPWWDPTSGFRSGVCTVSAAITGNLRLLNRLLPLSCLLFHRFHTAVVVYSSSSCTAGKRTTLYLVRQHLQQNAQHNRK